MDAKLRLLPIEAVNAELLNKVAQTFFDEDRGKEPDGPVPQWWVALNQECRKACRAETDEGVKGMIQSALDQVDTYGISPSVIGGIMLKAMVVGWRMAELYLSGQIEKAS